MQPAFPAQSVPQQSPSGKSIMRVGVTVMLAAAALGPASVEKQSFSGDVNYEAIFPFYFLLHKRAKPAPLPCATP
jgi:hypothetical protein